VRLHPSKFLRLIAIGLVLFGWAGRARAQACCAGTGTVTPARLGAHELALAGIQARAAGVLGTFDEHGHYVSSPSGTSEVDFEEDAFGAVRVLRRGQLALLVPLVETRRTARHVAEFGGGLGDINVSARYDFTSAGEHRYVPGLAALGGLTLPTGRPPESSSKPLATDSTGIGAFQGNLGVAVEQYSGPWRFGATVLVAKRTARSVQGVDETLGTQLTALGAVGYTFWNEAAFALVASYTLEDRAVINGGTVPASARHMTLLSVAGLLPVSDAWRVQGSVFLNPPILSLGHNLPALGGITFAVVHSWT
jgi:hypothetical protein